MGLITSIGNDRTSVTGNLRSLKHGIENAPMLQGEESRVKVAGTVKGFEVDSSDPEDWIYPPQYRVPRATLRSFSPHVLYAWCALQQAIGDANLTEEDIQDPESGLYTSSGGSMRSIHKHFEKMDKRGVMACNPLAIVASIAGTLTFNLVAALGVRGSSTGLVSACASSGHALGTALDEIRLGRQKRMLVVGAEDCNFESIVPFCGMRALSLESNPNMASRPFDEKKWICGNRWCGLPGFGISTEAEKRGFLPMPAFLVGDRRPTVITLPFLTLKVVDQDAMTNALKDSVSRPVHDTLTLCTLFHWRRLRNESPQISFHTPTIREGIKHQSSHGPGVSYPA